jgi:hypothetical protein
MLLRVSFTLLTCAIFLLSLLLPLNCCQGLAGVPIECGFSTAAADIPDVNGVHVVVVFPACYGWLHNFC